jgi:hypothetical protein
MPEHAKALGGQVQGKRERIWEREASRDDTRLINSESDYTIFRRSAYEIVLDDPLDDLARKAVVLAFKAGLCTGLSNVSEEHASDITGLADGVKDRLIERCRAYEMILRTTPVPERWDGRR